MVSANVVKVLDLVNSNDPVLTSEGFLDGVEDWANFWHSGATNTVLCLSRWEKGVIVVVRHLVPILH